jgi:hypothetical protein
MGRYQRVGIALVGRSSRKVHSFSLLGENVGQQCRVLDADGRCVARHDRCALRKVPQGLGIEAGSAYGGRYEGLDQCWWDERRGCKGYCGEGLAFDAVEKF